MTEKNLSLLERKKAEKKKFKIKTLNDFLVSNKKYENLDVRKGISFPKRSKNEKIVPSAQLAIPGDEKGIVSVFKDVYLGAYPFREFEDESEILKMIEDPYFYWAVFRNNSNAIIGCIGLEIDLENKSGILHGLVFKRQFQGLTSLYKLFTASLCSVLRIIKNDILSVSCEVRSAHSITQHMGKILGFLPVAFLPNKDIFFEKEESEIIVIVYYEDALEKYRSLKTVKFPFQVLKSYNYAVQKLGILGPFKVKNYLKLAYKEKKLNKCRKCFTTRVDKDKFDNELVEFAYSESQSFLNFFCNKYIGNIERISYSVASKEELFVFLEKLVQFIQENNIRYSDCFVSAYNALHQTIFLNAGFEAYGYIPAFKYNKMEKTLEDQVVFVYYKSQVDLERLQLIPETKELINNLKPLWKLPD
jgi:hypothetical protein